MNWFSFAFLDARLAKYLNNPSSSKTTEIIVIEKKRTNIFQGLIEVLLTSCSPTSFIGASPPIKRTTAPSKATIQYVSNLNFPIRMCGNNKIDNITSRNVIDDITVVAIITKKDYLPF